MPKAWRIRPHDPARIAALARAAEVPAVVAQLLLARGIDDHQSARNFLEVRLSQLRDPAELPGAGQAAALIMQAIDQRRRITVYGDYDVDGITATSLLMQCIRLLGGNAGYYVPHRLDEGYGLNDEAIRSLAEQETRLIVTVDCGVTSVDEAETARRLGVDLIVTDHHEIGPRLPDCAAIVHPRLPGTGYPFAGLSGAGVALKLAWALCQRANGGNKVGPRMKDYLVSAVGLAALGTVADVVPLVDENRALVVHGLASLMDHPSPGLQALLRITELARKQALEADDVGFVLAPRLNAAGRLGQAQLAVELLTTTAADRAAALAEYIHELNNSRQHLERSIYLAAQKQAQDAFDPHGDPALVLAAHGWHPGVIGIVAGRLAEKYHRPVILISLDELQSRPGVGSARSVPGFNLHQALAACTDHLLSHGGHAAAAGLKIDADRVDAFRADFCEYASAEIGDEQRVAELWIDAEVPFSALTTETVRQIERLAPFGQGNPRPLFSTCSVTLADAPRRIGGGGRHLAVRLAQCNQSLRAVGFGSGDWADELQQHDGPLDVAFRPVINEYRGRRSVELQLADWRPAKAPVVLSS